MQKGSPAADPAALPLMCLTLPRPVAQAVVRIGWPLPKFRAPGEVCLLAIHAGAQYDYRAARAIERQTGHTMPSAERAAVGIVGMGRWDGARLLDVQAIEPVFAKGAPGLWALAPEAAALVRARYAAVLEKAKNAPATGRITYEWGL